MIDSYIIEKNKILKKNRERENYLFGLCFGFTILLLNIYIFLSSKDITLQNNINLTFMLVGILLILAATIYPNSLDFIHKLFSKILGFIGIILFKILLIFIYFIFVTPVGLIMKKREKKQDLITSNFLYYNSDNFLQSNRRKGFYNIFQIFRIFSDERYVLMLPLIVILIIIGILLIFAQSSAIAPFIYTLF